MVFAPVAAIPMGSIQRIRRTTFDKLCTRSARIIRPKVNRDYPKINFIFKTRFVLLANNFTAPEW